jgi:hypothetical protein
MLKIVKLFFPKIGHSGGQRVVAGQRAEMRSGALQ